MTSRSRNSIGFLLAGPLALLPVACSPKGDTKALAETPTAPVIPVRVKPITVRTVERLRDVVGTLKGWDEVTIGAKRGGRVAKIHHDMGDRVKPGELLVELEPVDTDLAIDQAQKRLDADLAKLGLKALPEKGFDANTVPSVVQAKVALDRAKVNFGRERALMTKGAGTGQDYQNAENDEKGAGAAYDNARLTVESTLASAMASKVALDVAKQAKVDLQMKAPQPSKILPGLKNDLTFAVTKRLVSEGQMVKEGEALYDLVIDNPLRLWANVPEVYSSSVALGQDVRIEVIAYPGTVFLGKVSKINPSVDPVSRTFQVEAAVPNDDNRLRPGGFAKVLIVTNKRDEAVTVPREAVIKLAGVTKIYVIGDDNKSHVVKVEQATEGDGWVEVIGDVPRTGMVATEGVTQLADNTPVKIQPPIDEHPAPKKAGAEVSAPAEPPKKP